MGMLVQQIANCLKRMPISAALHYAFSVESQVGDVKVCLYSWGVTVYGL